MPPNYRQAQDLPLARHERRGAWALVALIVVAAGAVGLWEVTGAGTGPTPKGPCVSFTMPSSTGGSQVEHCGGGARRFCAQESKAGGAFAAQAQAACRRAHLLAAG
jgi:hypothetical protein